MSFPSNSLVTVCGYGSLKQCFLSLYEHVNHWGWGEAIYKMCSPRVYLPQILINLSEIGTENLHFNKLTRDSGAAGLWIIFRERTGSILFDSVCTITKKKKKKALRAVFRHLSRHLTFENDSRTFHRGLPSQEAKQQLLPQHWCLRKNAKNFFRADAPYSIHPF